MSRWRCSSSATISAKLGSHTYPFTFAFAKQYEVDPAHSNVQFQVRHLFSKVNGKFNEDWKLTASADTQEAPIGDLFSNFLDKSPDALFRRIDPDLFELFLTSGVYREYADMFLLPDPIDDIESLLKFGTEDNLMIGTDYSHTDISANLSALDEVHGWVEQGRISNAQAQKILESNSRAFYGI